MQNPESLRMAQVIFQQALTQSGPARVRFVEKACDGDPKLRAYVLKLLVNFDEASTKLSSPVPRNQTLKNTAADEWQIGRRIGGRWDVQQILRGGMGIVYIVYDDWSRERQAAKTFLDSVFARNPRVVERFTEEARNWVNLDAHDNVVRAKKVEIIGNRPFLFLEYVSSGDLNSWIGSSRLKHNLPQILRFAIQFCDGMNHILSKGIKAHRDIKPQNSLVTSEQILKLTDFGLAKVLEDIEFDIGALDSGVDSALNLSRTGVAAGTCTHMAPEQFQDAKHVDVRADVYSFGVMLFQMLVGGLPFTGRTWREFADLHANSDPPSPTSGDNVLDGLVLRCLAKKPSERYQDFHCVRRDLVAIYERRVGQFLGSAGVQGLTADQWHEKGNSLKNLGREEEALSCYDRAVALDPKWLGAAFGQKARCLQELGRYGEEIDCLDRILAADPGRMTFHARIQKGEALANLERYQEALECYEGALSITQSHFFVFRPMAEALLHLDRIDEAIHCYDAAIAQDKQNVGPPGSDPLKQSAQLFVEKGQFLNRVGRFSDAIEYFDNAFALGTTAPVGWSGKGDALSELGRKEEAITCYEQAISAWCRNLSDEHSASPGALLNYGSVLERAGRYQEAISRYDRAMGILLSRRSTHQALSAYGQAEIISSKLAELWVRLGVVLERLRQQAKSSACYKRAQILNPKVSINVQKEVDYLMSLVSSSQDRGPRGISAEHLAAINPLLAGAIHSRNCEQELETWKKIVKANAENLNGLVQIAELLGQLNRFEEQVEYADRALVIDRKCVGALNSKGWAYVGLKRYSEAISCFDRLLDIDTNNATTWYSKGVALGVSGRHHEAVSCYDCCLTIDTKFLGSWCNKGASLSSLGRYEEALLCFDRALALNRNEGTLWLNKGWTLQALGHPHDALTCFEEAKKLGRFLQASQAIEEIRKQTDSSKLEPKPPAGKE